MTFLIDAVNDRITALKSEQSKLKHHNILGKEDKDKLSRIECQIKDTQKFLDKLLSDQEGSSVYPQDDVDDYE